MSESSRDPVLIPRSIQQTAASMALRDQNALLKSSALQDAIFNSANFSCIATDENGVIQLFNVGAERMLGYLASEVLNKMTPADISDPQELLAHAHALSVELDIMITAGFDAMVFKAARGIEDIYALTYIRKDGSRFPAEVSITALRDAQEVIIGYLLIGTDNTARQQVEAERQHLLDMQAQTNQQLLESNITLQASEERLAVTLNSIGDAVIATDNAARVTLLNPLAERLTGWSQAEAYGLPVDNIFKIINKETRLRATIPVADTLAHGTIQGLANHTIIIARDGRECDIADSCAPIRDRDGQVIGAVLVFRDVTDKYATQQALRDKNVELETARNLAEKANLAKSDFLSSMSHELRTPLNAILGFAQLIESSVPPPSVTQKKSIDQILKAGWYLLELINEILDLALIESGKLSLSLEPVSLAEVMHECQIMIEPQAQKRGIALTFPQFAVQYFVKADRTRVKQILINLLSNAIKYNKLNGTVDVACIVSSPECLRIYVKDTGAGLAKDKIKQLFQPFNRLGQEAGSEEGTGIGLVVCKRLIEWMGGSIGVESAVGEGSRFWIEMNLTIQQVNISVPLIPKLLTEVQIPAAEQLRTLLYVEDNPANLMLVEDLITRRPDIRLLSATDGVSGVAMARQCRPDVILMDINLPGISGLKALKILADDPATARIPVLALSANAMPRDIERGLEAGFFRYLTKPIKVNEFLENMDEAMTFAEISSAKVIKEDTV